MMCQMTLWQYILRRILSALPTILGALVIMFILTRILPGDPALMILGPAHSSPENIEHMRKVMGLDHPLPGSVFSLSRPAHAGRSRIFLAFGKPRGKELIRRFPATFELTTSPCYS